MLSADILSAYLRQELDDPPKAGLEALVDLCNSKLQRNAFHPKALITRAVAYMKKGMYEEAFRDCSALLSKMPEHIQGHFLRGVVLDQLGRSQEALEEFSQVLALDPSHANAALSRAACFIKLGQPAEALDDYTQGLELDSKRSLTRHRKTFSTNATRAGSEAQSPDLQDLLRVKSFSTAVSPVPTAVSREPWSAQDLYLKGYAAKRNGDFAGAVQYFSAALDLQPGHFKCLFNRAFALERLGRSEDALEDYSKALAVEPRNSFTYYNRGILLDRLNRASEAVRDFSAALAIEDRPEFRHNRGLLHFKLHQLEAAAADFTRTLELDRRHPRTNTQRGKCFQLLGRSEEALKDFETAVLLHEDVEAARLWLNGQQETELAMQRIRGRKASEAILSYLAGVWAEKRGDGITAESYYSTAIECREQEAEFWHARAQCRLAQGREQEALSDCSASEERGGDVRYTRALAYTRLQLYEQAAEDLRGLAPTLAVLQALGYALAKAGNHHEAIKVYTQALEAEPLNPHSLHNRGSSFQHLRKHAEVLHTQAIEDFTREIAVRPSALAYFARGYCYELQGAADKAIADYSRSLELDM